MPSASDALLVAGLVALVAAFTVVFAWPGGLFSAGVCLIAAAVFAEVSG